MNNWTGKSITILGLSRSGVATARYIQKRGGQCFISETLPSTPTNEALRKEMAALGIDVEMGGHSKKCFTHAPLVVVSPGIPPSSPIMEQLRLSGIEVISEVELAYRETKIPIIGITGTNGKTTTTTLISEILTTAGKKAPTCGNIGRPLLSVLDEETHLDYLVAELSSFQLAFSPTFKAKVAVFTNFKPDHIDWHGSVESYFRAKLNLFSQDQSPEWSIILAGDPYCERIETYTRGKVLRFSRSEEAVSPYQYKAFLNPGGEVVVSYLDPSNATPKTETLFNVKSLKLIGQHNYENVLAAVSVAKVLGIENQAIETTCLSFKGVEHRLEPVGVVEGIPFYNDSKATNPDAAISALRSFEKDHQKVILIAGGRDKLGPLEEFVYEIKEHAQGVVLIGEASERFANALSLGEFASVFFASTLEDAIHKAHKLAQDASKDTSCAVLFSPACASFDMFKNFEARGQAFKTVVQQLKESLSEASTPKILSSSNQV
ncbi:MAG: UDP-N-acetylmuramoyl-L-alanine--D-glutamate ligase [Cyanobacteria bacterium]|nr:UDP-N-acetylmuramoyl-L-alanine--D-glutamate ligase [Cyanobacteriota bacterium]